VARNPVTINAKEERVLAQIAYDSGNMAGVVHALISSVESAIQVARWNIKLHTSQYAFTKVAEQVADVFVSYNGLTLFPPDPSDMSSPGFAQRELKQPNRVMLKY
jgi:hypothetical protein